jgi:hypothetical protein
VIRPCRGAPCCALEFAQSIKVACAFERMKTGRKFVPASHAGSLCHLRSESSLQGQVADLTARSLLRPKA